MDRRERLWRWELAELRDQIHAAESKHTRMLDDFRTAMTFHDNERDEALLRLNRVYVNEVRGRRCTLKKKTVVDPWLVKGAPGFAKSYHKKTRSVIKNWFQIRRVSNSTCACAALPTTRRRIPKTPTWW